MDEREQRRLEERWRFARLFDLYGALLTERRRKTFVLHEDDDLSLSEIAEQMGTSRQAVSALVQTSRVQLEHYEALLGFEERLSAVSEALERLDDLLPVKGAERSALRAADKALRGE